MTSSATGDHRDWTALPPDLLGSIAERLPIPDFFRLSAIAKPFAAALAVAGKRLLPSAYQYPLLMLPNSGGSAEDDIFVLLDVVTLKTYCVPVPELRGRHVVGCCDGWLVTIENETDVRLLNPLTRSQIALPSLDEIIEASQASGAVLKRSDYNAYICRARPGEEAAGRFIAVAFIGVYLAFAREGDDRWTYLDVSSNYKDVIYFQRKLYAMHQDSSVYAFDNITTCGPSTKVLVSSKLVDQWVDTSTKHLAVIDGELSQIWVGGLYFGLKMFKFDLDEGRWHQVKNFGDHVPFVGASSMSISTLLVQGIRRNHVYLTDGREHLHGVSYPTYYNLNEGEKSYTWYCLKASRKNWERTIWFMPNLS